MFWYGCAVALATAVSYLIGRKRWMDDGPPKREEGVRSGTIVLSVNSVSPLILLWVLCLAVKEQASIHIVTITSSSIRLEITPIISAFLFPYLSYLLGTLLSFRMVARRAEKVSPHLAARRIELLGDIKKAEENGKDGEAALKDLRDRLERVEVAISHDYLGLVARQAQDACDVFERQAISVSQSPQAREKFRQRIRRWQDALHSAKIPPFINTALDEDVAKASNRFWAILQQLRNSAEAHCRSEVEETLVETDATLGARQRVKE